MAKISLSERTYLAKISESAGYALLKTLGMEILSADYSGCTCDPDLKSTTTTVIS